MHWAIREVVTFIILFIAMLGTYKVYYLKSVTASQYLLSILWVLKTFNFMLIIPFCFLLLFWIAYRIRNLRKL